MKVAIAFLLALCTFVSNTSGGSKGAKAKEVDLKTKLHQKIFHHHHHHHHHHPHHHHHHHHHHPRHHHDALNKHHHHHHHHNHHHHHHYHNPFKHHLHRHHSHKKHFHHHPHKHPLHQHHHPHKKHVQQHHDHVGHHHSNRRSGIIHAPVELPNKLKLHVQIKDSQATKRQSLPDLLANLGQHLMKLGSSITPTVSSTGNTDKEGDVRNEVPEPKSSTVYSSPAVEDSSLTSETIPTDSQRKNVSLNEVEALLHSALDVASGDEMGSASSENGGAVETSDADTTNIVPKTSEVTKADRRNETFPEEPEIYGPEESREYDTSERQRESNYTLEEIAEKSFQTTESTDQKDEETNLSDVLKEDKSPIHGDQSKKLQSEIDVLTDSTDTNTEEQHEKTHENVTQDEPSHLTSPTLSEEPKSADLNSTLDEGMIDKETSKSGLTGKSGLAESEESLTGENAAAQDSAEEEVEKTEVSGSGEETSSETKDNTDGHNTAVADEKISKEERGARQESNKSNLDEEEDVSVQSIDQNEKENDEGHQEKEGESKSFVKETAKQSTSGESKPVPEENIDRQTVVNVAGNQIMGNQTEESFQADSTEGTDPKKGDSVLEDKPASNDPEKPVSVDSLDQGATIKDTKLRGDLDTPVTQPNFNEPERSISVTNLDKGFQTQNERSTSQLLDTAVTDLPSQRQTAINEIDSTSGAGSLGQESIEGTQGTQDEESQTDLEGFAEGPKTPAVLDELAGPSAPSASDPLVVNAEDSQVDNVHEDISSQETGTEDAADEIPVFMLSSPVGDSESFATDESTLSPLTTPTSAVTTSSASFIDSGLNMSPGDSESPSLLEGYSTFTATVAPSQGLFNSLTQRVGLQRDMLDDPVEESLETAVDSKSS